MPNAANRAAFGEFQKIGFCPRKQGAQLLPAQAGAFVKIGQSTALRKFVPRADKLAVNAAVDAIADQGAQLSRN